MPVPDASVTLDVTLPNATVLTIHGKTDSDGKAVLSTLTPTTGLYTFTVTDVSKPGVEYDPSQNNETSDSEMIPTVIHVASIDPRYKPIGDQFRVGSDVTIRDQAGTPAPDALVVVGVTTPGGARFVKTGTTDDSGTATVSLVTATPGTYTFTVHKVTRAPWTYDPAQNVETSDTITIP